MKLIKIKEKFIDKDNKEVEYYQVYIVLDSGAKIAVKAIEPWNKNVLKALAVEVKSQDLTNVSF